MSKRNEHWDIYEAAILLKYYIAYDLNIIDKETMVKTVSVSLREMAVNRGQSIDETYRNEIGISFQSLRMESAYLKTDSPFKETKLFNEIVDLYRTNINEFKSILSKAEKFISNSNNSN